MTKLSISLFTLLLWVKPSFSQITVEERLSDTSFTNNSGIWRLDPSDSSMASICEGGMAFSPPNCGCINAGQNKKGTGSISQLFDFGFGNTQFFTFSFQYHIVTGNTTDSFDVLEVKITDDWNPFRPPIVLKRFNNLRDAHQTYQRESIKINATTAGLSKYSSLLVPRLTFEGKDSSGLTAFYIDDIRLEMTSGPPILDFSASDTTITVGDSIDFFNNSTFIFSSIWKFYDGSSGQGYQEVDKYDPTGIRYLNTGTYSVTLTAYNQIATETKTKLNYITVSPKQGVGVVHPNAPTFSISSYPNPVADILHVELKDELTQKDTEVRIINQVGQVVGKQILPSGTTHAEFDLSSLAQGIYSIVVSCHDVVLVQKVVKQ